MIFLCSLGVLSGAWVDDSQRLWWRGVGGFGVWVRRVDLLASAWGGGFTGLAWFFLVEA